MLEAPIPQDDEQRLAALHSLGLLDTPPEQRFNRITRTAARLFNVPIATVTLVDQNRQWFKSRFGLFVTETPRNISFCGHAILGDDLLVIENALEDERFRDNPLVTGAPHIRFYAGKPLATPSGVKLGTLCLIGREPRAFSEEDRLTLEDMAGWAEREINLSLEFARMRGHLVAVMEQIVRGVMLLTSDGRVSWANASMEKLLGYDSAALNGLPLEKVMADNSVHAITNAPAAAGMESTASSLDAALRHKDGRIVTHKATLVSSTVDGERFATLMVRRS